MASVNKVILIGSLGKDPETRYLSNGDAVTNILTARNAHLANTAGNENDLLQR